MAPTSEFRHLPSVDRLISAPAVRRAAEGYPHETVAEAARRYLDEMRAFVAGGTPCPPFEALAAGLADRLVLLGTVGPRPVINATGVIIHTNLGRAPLSESAIAALAAAADGYNNLEIDLESGRRGSRNVHAEPILCQLTGAEAALVVNNNASAVLLALTALARRKEVIVSRGHAVEIGGKFRIPDVMRQSGAKLVEVGTTNRTYLSDYEQAITPRTGALLRVHSSNFRIIGFAEEVSIQELAELGRRHGIPVLDDLGSGCLLDTTVFGLGKEPRPQESIAAGADLAMFSGDKLLGGPQAGIIVGRREIIEKIKKHPLTRAVRIDKVRLAALAATLIHYLKGEAVSKIPVWRMIALPLEEIERRAEQWVREIGGKAYVESGESAIGGGSLPGATLPTRLVVIPMRGETKVHEAAHMLRRQTPPIIARIEKNALVLDPRTVLQEEDSAVKEALGEILRKAGSAVC